LGLSLALPKAQTGNVKIFELPGSVKLEMVLIPAGSFMMGSPSGEQDRDDDEKQHKVTLTNDFYIGKYEVTQAQWQAVMGNNPSYFKGANLPVEQVSWDDCQEFIKKINELTNLRINGFRLPTEAEWEYACRAGTLTPFHYGNSLSSSQANFDGNYPYNTSEGIYRKKPLPVGSFSPNAWGLYDMHGNVWEWCQDWYGEYPSGSVTNPTGANSGSHRVLRGGGWNSGARICRSAFRLNLSPDNRDNGLGLRLCLPAGRH